MPVDDGSPGGRLRSLRKVLEMDQQALADVLGVARTQISKYERGDARIPDHLIIRAAELFRVTPAFIRYGDTRGQMAKVVGTVGADGRVEPSTDAVPRYIEVPDQWHDAVAYHVTGTGCWPIYTDGDDIVVRGPPRLIDDEIIGRMCVIETMDGISLVRRVRRGITKGTYMLESSNAPLIEGIHLASARPVKLHVQR